MRAQLVISLDEMGNLSVSGPIDQRLLCYGMLEMAKESINTHHMQKSKNLIQPATLGMLPSEPS